jgi:CRP-like cAMP-binding protein
MVATHQSINSSMSDSSSSLPTEPPALVLKGRFVKSGKTSSPGKLSFRSGDLVDIWQQNDAKRLWYGRLVKSGEVGFFPSACVSVLTDDDLPRLRPMPIAAVTDDVPPLPPSPGIKHRHSRRRHHHSHSPHTSHSDLHRRRSHQHSATAAADAELLALSKALAQDQYLLEDDEDDSDDDGLLADLHPESDPRSDAESNSGSPPPPDSANPAARLQMQQKAAESESPPSGSLVDSLSASAAGGNAERRARIVAEFLQTERTFVEALSVLTDVYHAPLRQARPPILAPADLSKIFDTVQALRACNTRFMLALASRVEPWADANCIGDCLLSLIGELDVYLQFVNIYDLAAGLINELLVRNARFAAFCAAAQAHERSKRLDLRAYMIVPIQRIPRYVMLLADLVKSTSLEHNDASALHEAERRMREFADAMNQRKRERDADEANRALAARFEALEFRLADPGRVLVQQGAVLSSTGFDTTAPVGVSERVLFLFSDILLCAAPLKGDRFHFLWKVMLGTSTMTTRALDGDASVLVEVNEARWQPTPPFAVPTLRSFTYSRAGDAAPLRKGRAAAPAKSIDWAALVGAQIAEQRKVYRPPAGKRGAYIERNLLSAGEWVLLSAGSTTRTLRDGEVLIDQGVPFAGLFVVLDGALEVEREVDGRWLSLGTCNAGSLIGELSFLSGDTTCRYVARGDAGVRVRRLGDAALSGVLEAQSDVAEHFFTLICVRIGNLTMRLALRDAIGSGVVDEQRVQTRGAVRSAIDLGRNDSARVKSIAESLRLHDTHKDVVFVKSFACAVRRKAFKATTELYLFDTILAFTYKMFSLNQRVVAPWSLVQHVELAPTQISLHLSDERESAVDRYVLLFESSDVAREAFSTIESLRGKSSSNGGGRATLTASGGDSSKARLDESSAELYADFAPRDSLLLLNSADWRLVFENATAQEFRAGDVVLGEGEQYQRIYQLSDGMCNVLVGGKHIAELKPGAMFGELTFLVGGGATASIVAQSDTVTVVFVERLRLQKLFDANPQLAGKFYKFLALFMAKRLRERELQLLSTTTTTTTTS